MYKIYFLSTGKPPCYYIKMKAKTIRDLLTWSLTEERSGTETRITTNLLRKTHVIVAPRRGVSQIDIEHAYGHAYLAESAHPLFSTPWFLPGTPGEVISEVEPLFHAASDWYVDGLISMVFPEEFKKGLSQTLHLMIEESHEKALPPQAIAEMLSHGSLLAQAERLKLSVKDEPLFVIGVVEDFRKAFLRHNPEKPTIRGLRALLNELFKPLNGAQVTVYRRHRIDVWNLAMDSPLKPPVESENGDEGKEKKGPGEEGRR